MYERGVREDTGNGVYGWGVGMGCRWGRIQGGVCMEEVLWQDTGAGIRYRMYRRGCWEGYRQRGV